MRAFLSIGLALTLLVGCGFDVRSSQYTCEVESDCESGRTCEMGWCVVASDLIAVDAAVDFPDADPASPDADPPDAAPPGTPDAAPPQPVTVTLQGSAANTIDPNNSISCNSSDPDFFHADNRYLRKYILADEGITSNLVVTSVDLGVQEATSLTGTQPIVLSLYTLQGAFLLANMTLLDAQNLDVADQTLQVLTVPVGDVIVPAGSTLVVEVFTPDGQTDSNRFFIGSNTGAESDPSFVVAPSTGCDITEPTPVADLGIAGLQMSIVLNVTGDHLSTP